MLGSGLGDPLDLQLLDLVAIAIALDARLTGVDDVADTGYRERCLGHIGREHDAPTGVRAEYPLLFRRGEPCIERQDFRARRMMLAQHFRRLSNLALTGQEDQHIARTQTRQRIAGIRDRFVDVGFVVAPTRCGARASCARRLVGRGERTVAYFHREQTPRHLDHGRAREVIREALGIDRRGSHDHFQVRAARQQLLEVAEQKIDVEAALMRLVDDDRVVLAQIRIGLRLGEQDAVGHQLDIGVGTRAIGEADLETDRAAQLAIQLLRYSRGGGTCSDTPRLGVPDQAVNAAS